jgi:hypothetical protein
MKINLITQENYNLLKVIYTDFPTLTLQNKGYEEINKEVFNLIEKAKLDEVTNVLKNAVLGFRRFQNFKINKENKIVLRLQYNYNYFDGSVPFTGVGYILLDELLNGFTD